TGERCDCFNLVDRCPEFRSLPRSTVLLGDQYIELTLRGLPPPIGHLVVAENTGELRPGEPVERIALGGGAAQSDLVGLPVDHDQLFAELAEYSDGRAATSDDGTTAALYRDGPAEDEFGPRAARLIQAATGFGDALCHSALRSNQPAPFNVGTGTPLPHHSAVSATAQQQAERGDDHGLACTGLARDGGETGAERQHRVLDDPEITNRQFFDHGRGARFSSEPTGPRHPVTGRWNLLTKRSVNGPWCSRARRTGMGERRTTTRAPRGRSRVLRPSHQSTPVPWVRSSTSTANTESGPTTSGRANKAWALSGTSSIASRLGQTTGP